MNPPYKQAPALTAETYQKVLTRTVFDHFKWDPQVEDVNILADYPLILEQGAWQTIKQQAEKLAAETLALETELRRRPELHQNLGLPPSVVRHLRNAASKPDNARNVRLIRFDFHYTADGWRISEANADVPGGFIEAVGFTNLMAEHYPQYKSAGNPSQVLAREIRKVVPEGGLVALVHATAYTDDRQMMLFLGRDLEREGLKTALVSPSHIRWRDGKAMIETDWLKAEADFVFRFFPGEWLINLPRATEWGQYFHPQQTPRCNPGYALLAQTKRLPLIWDKLTTPAPTWRALLPETRDPRTVDTTKTSEWILKLAFGRIGEDIGMPGVTVPKELQDIQKQAKRNPGAWIAQKRFHIVPVETTEGPRYPCFGVYTINNEAVGIYGRLNDKPLINSIAPDIAVLIEGSTT